MRYPVHDLEQEGLRQEGPRLVRRNATLLHVEQRAFIQIADGIAVKHPGKVTLPLVTQYVDEIVEVTEEEIARGIFFAVQNNRLVVEGAGAGVAR